MHSVTQTAPAKINLTLDILAKRPDGYHDLRSVMQTVSLCDEVRLSVGKGSKRTLLCRWKHNGSTDALPQGEANLCWRAADAFFARVGEEPEGLSIIIDKCIPMQAGLAGGSADAAAVLRGLNTLLGEPLDPFSLARLGAQVGSDVPFCVLGGTALCEGRGEVVTLLPSAPKMFVVLCKPQFGISTAELYAKADSCMIPERPDSAAMLEAIRQGSVERIGALVKNVFEPIAMQQYPQIASIKKTMLACGACGAQMTGSGSVVFGIFQSRENAQTVYAALSGDYRTSLAVSV